MQNCYYGYYEGKGNPHELLKEGKIWGVIVSRLSFRTPSSAHNKELIFFGAYSSLEEAREEAKCNDGSVIDLTTANATFNFIYAWKNKSE